MKRNNVGRYKTWFSRLQSYTSSLSFIMVLYLYIIEEPMGLRWQYWVVILILFLVVILVADIVFIYPSEQEYMSKKNPEWVDMHNDIHMILRHLDDDKGDGKDDFS